MATLADVMKNESNKTFTENGATALKSTTNPLLDLFGMIGSLRETDDQRIYRLFAEAYNFDKLLATKMLFYARDVREGLGERAVPRKLLTYVAKYHPEALKNNIKYIGLYGRYDDLYALIGTQLESDMWAEMKSVLEQDIQNMEENKPVSLLAKWVKTADASSKVTRRLGILTAQKLGYAVYDFKRIIRKLRRYLQVVEVAMSAQNWNEINYESVPSKAMMQYRHAFFRHDENRFVAYKESLVKGEAKINASTLYPYDIIESYMRILGYDFWSGNYHGRIDDILEAQWKALPNYVDNKNVLVIADTSGSMEGRPLNSAVGLAIYFAERNNGPFHNMWMSFSHDSKIQYLKGETLAQKLLNLDTSHWQMNTNLEAAFNQILNLAVKNHIAQEDMVSSIVVISDMEIDACTSRRWSFYDHLEDKFNEAGYKIPNIVFWNVNSRHDVFHVDAHRRGVQLCSGQSTVTFKHLLEAIGMNPVEAMLKVLNSERYDLITIA